MLYITFFLNLHPFRPYPLNHYLHLGLPLPLRPLLMVVSLLIVCPLLPFAGTVWDLVPAAPPNVAAAAAVPEPAPGSKYSFSSF